MLVCHCLTPFFWYIHSVQVRGELDMKNSLTHELEESAWLL